MPDIIGANGLTVKTAAEITAELQTGLRGIYGADINVDQNSPDGQVIGIITQEAVDIRELAVQINAGFDPDQAVGRTLDERVVINNIERNGGTYTIQPVSITVDRTVTLQGLDAAFADPNGVGYTVQDNAGTQFILVDTITLTAGTTSLNFRARTIGQVEVVTGTITNPGTIVQGVTAINNPSAALTVGQNQESDGQLRVRRQRSVALSSTGYLNGLLGNILSIEGVTDAVLYENVTNADDSNAIPAHGIWLIVEGGANTEIGNLIYSKKSYGANMKGAIDVNIITQSGVLFVAKFDRPDPFSFYIRFDIQRTVPGFVFDQTTIKNYIADNLIYTIGQYADTSTVTVQAIAGIAAQGGGGAPVNVEISYDGITWEDYLVTNTLKTKFVVDAANIAITVL
jgi:uncharacterized phage protein gp47/JayE